MRNNRRGQAPVRTASGSPTSDAPANPTLSFTWARRPALASGPWRDLSASGAGSKPPQRCRNWMSGRPEARSTLVSALPLMPVEQIQDANDRREQPDAAEDKIKGHHWLVAPHAILASSFQAHHGRNLALTTCGRVFERR